MKRLILLLLIFASVCTATDYTRYVDPAADAGGDGTTDVLTGSNCAYQSLTEPEAELDGVAINSDTVTIYCASSDGTDDTASVTFVTWASGVTIIVEGTDFTGKWDDSAYVLYNNDADTDAINPRVSITIRNIQVQVVATGTNNRYGINLASASVAEIISIENCLIKGSSTSTGNVYGIYQADTDITSYISNTAAWGFVNGTDASQRGFYNVSGTANYYNCVSYGNYDGFLNGGTATYTNCVAGNNTDDFSGGTISYCCSDDGDGTNSQSPNINWAGEFTDAASGDFSLVANANCIDNGTDDPGGANQPDTDIEGTAWVTPWSIGAFEYTTSSSIVQIIANKKGNKTANKSGGKQ